MAFPLEPGWSTDAMVEELKGPMCSTRCGPGWIDDGTLCRQRTCTPGPTGVRQVQPRPESRAGMARPAVWYAKLNGRYIIREFDTNTGQRKYDLRYPTQPRKDYYEVDDFIFLKSLSKKQLITTFDELKKVYGNSGESALSRIIKGLDLEEDEEFKTCWQILDIHEAGVLLRGAIYVDDTAIVHLERKWAMNWTEFNRHWILWYGVKFEWARTSAYLAALAIVVSMQVIAAPQQAGQKLGAKVLLKLGRKAAKRNLRELFFKLIRGGVLLIECTREFIKAFAKSTGPFAKAKARLYHQGQNQSLDDYNDEKLIRGGIAAGSIAFVATLISKGLDQTALKIIPNALMNDMKSKVIVWVRQANFGLMKVFVKAISSAAMNSVSDPQKPFQFDVMKYEARLWAELKTTVMDEIKNSIGAKGQAWIDSL